MIKSPIQNADFILTVIVLVFFTIFFVKFQILLLNVIEWGDESETIVIAKLIASGKRLYSEVFSQHGPLTFLPGLVTEQFGDFKHSGHRIAIAVGQILALVSIVFSPLLKECRTAGNIYICVAASMLAIYMPPFFAHMYMYHTMGGIFLTVILAQYTLPAIATPERLTPTGIVVGNVLVGSLPFLSIAYSPAALILFLVSLRPQHIKQAFMYVSCGAALNLIFLVLIGSLSGYLATHIYLNFFIYSSLPNNLPGGFSDIYFEVMRLATESFPGILIFLVTTLSIMKLSMLEKGIPWRSILVAVGIFSLMIRGEGFRGLPYYYSFLAFPLVFLVEVRKVSPRQLIWLGVILFVFLAKISLSLPGDKARMSGGQIPSTSEFSELVQTLTAREDRIISYSFNNLEYLLSERLPASGHIYYLPQQEIYSESPKLEILIDACREIEIYLPKVMYIDKWKAWNRIPWKSYGKCIQGVVDKYYVQVKNKPYYVRQDVLTKHMGLNFSAERLPTIKEVMSVEQLPD